MAPFRVSAHRLHNSMVIIRSDVFLISLWAVQASMGIEAKRRFRTRQLEFRDEIVHVL